MLHAEITIAPVIGGFIVTYPRRQSADDVEFVQEIATTAGKAMRIAKAAVEEFSLVTKSKDDTAE